jgi:fatty acid-binding protein DegV
MNNYVLTTNSCCDLPNELVKELKLEVIPLSVEIKGKVYYNHPDERYIKTKDFYEMMREKEVATTSLINVGEFLVFFKPFLKAGLECS